MKRIISMLLRAFEQDDHEWADSLMKNNSISWEVERSLLRLSTQRDALAVKAEGERCPVCGILSSVSMCRHMGDVLSHSWNGAFDRIDMIHAVDGFRGGRSEASMKRKASKGFELGDTRKGEICVADRLRGEVGLIVEGTVTGAFDSDCYSEIVDNLRVASRASSIYHMDGLVDSYTGPELWVVPTAVVGIVSTGRGASFAQKLADRYDLPLYRVDRKGRRIGNKEK